MGPALTPRSPAGTEPSPALLVSSSCRRTKRSCGDVGPPGELPPSLCPDHHDSPEPPRNSGKKAACKEKSGMGGAATHTPPSPGVLKGDGAGVRGSGMRGMVQGCRELGSDEGNEAGVQGMMQGCWEWCTE